MHSAPREGKSPKATQKRTYQLENAPQVRANSGEIDGIRVAATASSLFVKNSGLISVALTLLELRDGGEMHSVLESGLKGRPQALVLLGSPLFQQRAQIVAEFCARNRLPAISPFRNFAENGGLMSYGVNFALTLRQLAPYVVKILNGAKPGDLAIEQPSHFEFFVNQKTAKALGLSIAQAVLVRADEVIR